MIDALLKKFENKEIQEYIRKGIEENRKGNLKIEVVSNGKRVGNAKVNCKLKKHKFKFGANLFMLDEFESEEKNKTYEDLFFKVFNLGVLPFYWSAVEPQKGEYRYGKDSIRMYRRPSIDKCLEFCKKHDIEPKGHCLNMDGMAPEWVKILSAEEHKAELEKHIERVGKRYAEKIPCFEVVNETLLRNGATPLYYGDDIIKWSFNTSRKYLKNNRLMINENARLIFPEFCGDRSSYYMLCERELLKGSSIDTIGFQAHYLFGDEFSKRFADPDFMIEFLDCYARLGLPLQMTEVSIPMAFGEKFGLAWQDAALCSDEPFGTKLDYIDEDKQAQMLVNLYSLWFSHKNMEAIIYWNLVDGYCYSPDTEINNENRFFAGLLDHDLNKKKVYLALERLINETWTTNIDDFTDSNGAVRGRAFYGDYEITVVVDGKSVTKQAKFYQDKDVISIEI